MYASHELCTSTYSRHIIDVTLNAQIDIGHDSICLDLVYFYEITNLKARNTSALF